MSFRIPALKKAAKNAEIATDERPMDPARLRRKSEIRMTKSESNPNDE
jgi:hypothetical protein